MFGFLANAAICLGVMYNIHKSFKAASRPERKFFKHYFVAMALILAIDNTLAFLLHRIPYYTILKLATLLWLSVPNSTGPHFIYNVYIKNIDRLFEGDIDAVITSLKGYCNDIRAKYDSVVKKGVKGMKKGEISIGSESISMNFKDTPVESSEAEQSVSAVSDNEDGPTVLSKDK